MWTYNSGARSLGFRECSYLSVPTVRLSPDSYEGHRGTEALLLTTDWTEFGFFGLEKN
jgi:hypothetical protein